LQKRLVDLVFSKNGFDEALDQNQTRTLMAADAAAEGRRTDLERGNQGLEKKNSH